MMCLSQGMTSGGMVVLIFIFDLISINKNKIVRLANILNTSL